LVPPVMMPTVGTHRSKVGTGGSAARRSGKINVDPLVTSEMLKTPALDGGEIALITHI
jgi:hypothetical protein